VSLFEKTGRPKELDAPSQETGLEKFSNASSGIRSGELSLLSGFPPCHFP